MPDETFQLQQVLHLDNSKCKTHGEALERIHSMVFTLSQQADHYVRERGFSRFQTGTQTLFKVVGVSDMALWTAKRAVFDEIPPATVKKVIAGKGNATKEKVAPLPEMMDSKPFVYTEAARREPHAEQQTQRTTAPPI